MQKKFIHIFIVAILCSELNAGILDGISSSLSSLSNSVSSSIGGITNSSTGSSALNTLNTSSFRMDDLTSLAQTTGLRDVFSSGALSQLSNLGSGANTIYQYCYDFQLPSIRNPISLINPCDLGDGNGNICQSAPDLSSMGFRKRSGLDLRRYCNTLGRGTTSTTASSASPTPIVNRPNAETINVNLQKINTSSVLKDRYEKIRINKANGGSSASSGGISSTGGKRINNSSIALSNNTQNQEVSKVYLQNNYKGFKLLDDANSVSDNTVQPIDLSKISSGYATMDDYRVAVEDLTQIYYMNENNINLTYLKNTADLVFNNINNTTSNIGEQEVQKEAEATNLLKTFEEQLDLWKVAEIQKRQWLLIKEGEQVINPTDEILDTTNDTTTKIAMVYFGEKNKNEKAKLVADVEAIVFDTYEKAKNIVEMAKIKNKTYDRATEYNRIITSLSGIN